MENSEILQKAWLGGSPAESAIRGLIEECYILEQAGKMGAALRPGQKALHQARRANHPYLDHER